MELTRSKIVLDGRIQKKTGKLRSDLWRPPQGSHNVSFLIVGERFLKERDIGSQSFN